MKIKETSLLATFKNVNAFGVKFAADFPPNSVGGQQFAQVSAALPVANDLGAQQSSGGKQEKAGVKSKALADEQIHGDMLAIADAAHSLALIGTAGLQGKFLMPRNHAAQDMLNAARAFQKDATPLAAQFISLGLPADFLAQLGAHISDFENAISAKTGGSKTQAGATGGIENLAHKAMIALHVLNTVVRNTYRNDAAKLAEWAVASHVEHHTPVPRTKPAPAPLAKAA